jgi:hypothetical protein
MSLNGQPRDLFRLIYDNCRGTHELKQIGAKPSPAARSCPQVGVTGYMDSLIFRSSRLALPRICYGRFFVFLESSALT